MHSSMSLIIIIIAPLFVLQWRWADRSIHEIASATEQSTWAILKNEQDNCSPLWLSGNRAQSSSPAGQHTTAATTVPMKPRVGPTTLHLQQHICKIITLFNLWPCTASMSRAIKRGIDRKLCLKGQNGLESITCMGCLCFQSAHQKYISFSLQECCRPGPFVGNWEFNWSVWAAEATCHFRRYKATLQSHAYLNATYSLPCVCEEIESR